MEGEAWSLMNVVGVFLLLAVIGWAVLRNRKNRDTTIPQAEEGARRLREQLNEEDQRGGS